MVLHNPKNNYKIEVGFVGPFLGCLWLGWLYFLLKGCYRHMFLSFFLFVVTFGVSWLIYPFFAASALQSMYVEKGFRQVQDSNLR